MRMLSKILASSAAAAALVALVVGPALADPPSGVTPKVSDVVGVGSDTTEFLFDQFSHDYNNQHKTGTQLYSWDATNPSTGAQGDPIAAKSGCSTIPRPDGSNAGISALETSQTLSSGTGFCIDYARSARGRSSTDPACASGGICFVALAGDAITWAARDAASGGTNAPASLTLSQLQKIYLCQVTNWSKAGGANAPIHPFLPVTGSGIRSQFLLALGGGTIPLTPGACVNSSVQQNEGIDPLLNDPDAIVPFSVGKYIAEVYHSAPCTNASCTGSPACAPQLKENLFGCDEAGVLTIKEIQGTKPTAPWPLPASPTPPAINGTVKVSTRFDPLFQNTIYDVVRYSSSTADHIPGYLEPFFAAPAAATPGWACSNAKAQTDIKSYGFLLIARCGVTS